MVQRHCAVTVLAWNIIIHQPLRPTWTSILVQCSCTAHQLFRFGLPWWHHCDFLKCCTMSWERITKGLLESQSRVLTTPRIRERKKIWRCKISKATIHRNATRPLQWWCPSNWPRLDPTLHSPSAIQARSHPEGEWTGLRPRRRFQDWTGLHRRQSIDKVFETAICTLRQIWFWVGATDRNHWMGN